jgi:hypothetical protein
MPWNSSEADVSALNYGISNFANYGFSALSGLNYLTFTGWSGINDIVKISPLILNNYLIFY